MLRIAILCICMIKMIKISTTAGVASESFVSNVIFAGFHTSGARDIMKTPVNSSNNVSFTNAIIVGILVLGIFMTFVITISLIVCRRRRYLKWLCHS